MTSVLYYTLAVCFFGWIGITAFLVISNALDPKHVPFPRRGMHQQDFVDSVQRPYVDSATQTVRWKIEPIDDEP